MHRTLIVSFLIAIGCGNPEQQSYPQFGTDNQSLVELAVIDCIGVEFGDSNYVFGAIGGVDRGVNGEILVLDIIRNRIMVYSSEGVFLRQVGRYGSGPGEFLMPVSFVVLQDGSVCVVDESGWQRFRPDGEFIQGTPFRTGALQMSSFSDRQIVGITSEFGFVRNGFEITKQVSLWNDSTPEEPELTLLTRVYLGNAREDLIRIDMLDPIRFTVGDSRIYIAPDPQNLPEVIIFGSSGDSLGTLRLDYPEVPKPDAEIEEEKVFIESFVDRSTAGHMQVDMTPFSYYPRIKNMGTDSSGNLWVQRGFESQPTFDVFSAEDAGYLYSAHLQGIENATDWVFDISDHGIIAYPQDPNAYYQIYIIE